MKKSVQGRASTAKSSPNSKKAPFYKKWWFWLIIGVVVIGGIGSLNQEENEPAGEQETTSSKTDSLEFLRKCTVMEAADIYASGIGGSRGSAFDDALKTCQSWEREWNDFEEIVEADWSIRKDEEIDGKPLSHYLEVLGW